MSKLFTFNQLTQVAQQRAIDLDFEGYKKYFNEPPSKKEILNDFLEDDSILFDISGNIKECAETEIYYYNGLG